MSYTKRFDEIGAGDVAETGGKGANLGELTRAGLPVPAGFVVTTAAYDTFVAANDLTDTITELATRVGPGDTAAFAAAADEIRRLFRAGEVPDEIERAIRTAYADLTHTVTAHGEPLAVAVRSSATAEDLAGASFAGQQDTYLNVRGDVAVAAAVTDCWASLWTARAMAYRARQGIAPKAVSLAVVVQQMVQAESSGVMFTANPANGRRTEAVISAACGLGESVVSGSVSTDDHIVDKASGALISRHTADKAVMTVYTDTGTGQRPVPAARRRATVLDDAAMTELAGLGARIEDHYGAPQDIEWARAGGEFFIVQSRPITALPYPIADPPTAWPVPYPHGLYFRASIVEQMPDPLTPLFADLIDGVGDAVAEHADNPDLRQQRPARRRHRAAHDQRLRLLLLPEQRILAADVEIGDPRAHPHRPLWWTPARQPGVPRGHDGLAGTLPPALRAAGRDLGGEEPGRPRVRGPARRGDPAA